MWKQSSWKDPHINTRRACKLHIERPSIRQGTFLLSDNTAIHQSTKLTQCLCTYCVYFFIVIPFWLLRDNPDWSLWSLLLPCSTSRGQPQFTYLLFFFFKISHMEKLWAQKCMHPCIYSGWVHGPCNTALFTETVGQILIGWVPWECRRTLPGEEELRGWHDWWPAIVSRRLSRRAARPLLTDRMCCGLRWLNQVLSWR